MKVKDVTGKKFGRLTVVSYVPSKGWLCDCLCGKQAIVRNYYFNQINYPTCGKCKTKQTYPLAHKSHESMLQRCYNTNSPDYPRYGGRGITVCDRWRLDFYYFLADLGDRPGYSYTLDRIDPNGNYEPSNCRWADKYTQGNNRSDSKAFDVNNIIHTPNGYFR